MPSLIMSLKSMWRKKSHIAPAAIAPTFALVLKYKSLPSVLAPCNNWPDLPL